MAIKCVLDLDVPWPSNVSDEASRVQDVVRIELVLDPLHDPAGPARIVPDADGDLHDEPSPRARATSPPCSITSATCVGRTQRRITAAGGANAAAAAPLRRAHMSGATARGRSPRTTRP